MFFYLHCGRGFNCLHGRRMKGCLISFFCVVIRKTISVHTKGHVTLDTSEYHRSHLAPRWTHATSPFCWTGTRPVLIVTCIQSSDVIIWFQDGRRAQFTHETSRCIGENCSATTGVEQHNRKGEKSELLQNTWWKCFLPLPKNRYSAAC